jgi:hypothetical protein
MTDDLYQPVQGEVLPPRQIAQLLVCRIVIIVTVATIAIAVMSVYCPKDSNKDTVTILVGFVGAAIVGLLGLAKSQENSYLIKMEGGKNQQMLQDHACLVKDQLSSLANATYRIATKSENADTAAALKEETEHTAATLKEETEHTAAALKEVK